MHTVSCAGNLHSSVVELFLRQGAPGVMVGACPPRDCTSREGPRWLGERFYHERAAELQARVDRRRVCVTTLVPGDRAATIAARQTLRWLLAVAVTGAALFGLSRASAAPLSFHESDAARLRLSWSARPERIEVCRTLSAEELAEREEHMRQRVECDGCFATYVLRVEADGRVVGEAIVRGAGGDRHRNLRRTRPA